MILCELDEEKTSYIKTYSFSKYPYFDSFIILFYELCCNLQSGALLLQLLYLFVVKTVFITIVTLHSRRFFITIVTLHSRRFFITVITTQWTLFTTVVTRHSGHFLLTYYCNYTFDTFIIVVTLHSGHFLLLL